MIHLVYHLAEAPHVLKTQVLNFSRKAPAFFEQ